MNLRLTPDELRYLIDNTLDPETIRRLSTDLELRIVRAWPDGGIRYLAVYFDGETVSGILTEILGEIRRRDNGTITLDDPDLFEVNVEGFIPELRVKIDGHALSVTEILEDGTRHYTYD